MLRPGYLSNLSRERSGLRGEWDYVSAHMCTCVCKRALHNTCASVCKHLSVRTCSSVYTCEWACAYTRVYVCSLCTHVIVGEEVMGGTQAGAVVVSVVIS